MSAKINPSLDARLDNLILQLLDAEHYKSALFWAERYFYLDMSCHVARHRYSLSLLRCGQTQSALHVANVPEDNCDECTEIFAKCCTALGRHDQANAALEGIARRCGLDGDNVPSRTHSTSSFPDVASLLCKAGSSAMQANQPSRAIENYHEALTRNPYLWEAFEGLCALGSFTPIDVLFPLTPSSLETADSRRNPTGYEKNPKSIPSHMKSGLGFFTPDLSRKQKSHNFLGIAEAQLNDSLYSYGPENSMIAQTRVQGSSARNLSSADEMGPVPKKARKIGAAPAVKMPAPEQSKQFSARGLPQKARQALHATNLFSSVPTQRTEKPEAGSTVNARRSTRLLSSASSSSKEPSRLQKYTRARKALPRTRSRSHASEDEGTPPVEVPLSPSISPMLSPLPDDNAAGPSTPSIQQTEWKNAELQMMGLLRQHATALQLMSGYACQAAVQEIETFPLEVQRTPWALSLIGRAYYEMVDYSKAEGAFKELRKLDPYRIRDMELYSTLLWHLQKSVRLSFLAQELVAIDSRAPQTWIAVGNCFSLQKERSKAMSCFQRAAQLDAGCAYAYTLCGHESIDEDVEAAITFFQNAVRVDRRHYNAWYGLGTCYLRMSKLRQAEYHYRKATELHPTNAVLLGCLGMALERRGLREAAFELYEGAVDLSPNNALVRYRRAKILISMQRYQEALKDLLHLRDIAPDESNVVYQLAKLYRLMGNTVQSALQLATARDLSPQSMNKIKKLVETTQDDEETEGNMDEG